MNLVLVDRRAARAGLPLEAATLAALVRPLGRPDWELNLALVDDREMIDLNERWYGGRGVTDVLSFSYLETAGEGPCALAAGVGEAACDLWVPLAESPHTMTAGDVVLAAAYVERCARSSGWDLAGEWALLLVHGALHILGWTHATVDEQRAMQAREAALLRRAGFEHPLLTDSKED